MKRLFINLNLNSGGSGAVAAFGHLVSLLRAALQTAARRHSNRIFYNDNNLQDFILNKLVSRESYVLLLFTAEQTLRGLSAVLLDLKELVSLSV